MMVEPTFVDDGACFIGRSAAMPLTLPAVSIDWPTTRYTPSAIASWTALTGATVGPKPHRRVLKMRSDIAR